MSNDRYWIVVYCETLRFAKAYLLLHFVDVPITETHKLYFFFLIVVYHSL